VARLLAETYERSVHLHADDFFHHVVGGYVEPWLPEARAQNEAVMRAVFASFVSFWHDGYDVVLDGVVGPWFVPALLAAVPSEMSVDYVILLPELRVLHARVASREGHGFRDQAATEHMHGDFARERSAWQRHVLDTSETTPDEVLAQVRDRLDEGALRLG
jgi:hypothetical protein